MWGNKVRYTFTLSVSLHNPSAGALRGVRTLLAALPDKPYWISADFTCAKSPNDEVTRRLSDKRAIQEALDRPGRGGERLE